jgi:hypothetical protein
MSLPGNPPNIRSGPDLAASLTLSWVVAIGLLAWLIDLAGVWTVLAWTRLLDLTIVGGLVKLHDAHAGYITGVPDIELYQYAREPVELRLVLICAVFYLLAWFVRSAQFNDAARLTGLRLGYGTHAKAYLYGSGADRFMPFRFGVVASADSLEANGATPSQARRTMVLMDLLLLIEVAIFVVVTFVLVGTSRWFLAMIWPSVILAAAYLLVRDRTNGSGSLVPGGSTAALRSALADLVAQPLAAARMVIAGVVSFLMVEGATFSIMMAFTTLNIIMTVPPKLLLLGLTAAAIARLIPVTPGGLGQGEMAFVGAVWWAGAGVREAVVIALLSAAVRYVVGMGLFATVALGTRSGTSMSTVTERFRGLSAAPTAGADR